MKVSSLTNAIRRVGVGGGQGGWRGPPLAFSSPSLAFRTRLGVEFQFPYWASFSGIAISVQTGTEALDPTLRHQTHYSLYYQPTKLSTKKHLQQLQESVMAFGSCCCCCHNYCCCCVAFAAAPHKSCVTPRLHTTVCATTIATATAYSEAGSTSTRLSFFDGL